MISYKVEFPTTRSFSLKIDGANEVAFPVFRTVEGIGGDIDILLDERSVLKVPYREDISPDFTLEGYKARAIGHAEDVVAKLVEAAQMQTAKSHEEMVNEKIDLIISLMPPLRV